MAAQTQKYRNTALKATKQAITANPGTILGWHIYNQDTSDTYLQVYDALTANVTVGTTVPTVTFWVPAASGLDDWAIRDLGQDLGLVDFQTGLVIAATTTVGGSTNPTNGLLANLRWI